MPDVNAPVNLIQNSFTSGELSSEAYGRTDITKYSQGAAVMRNFFVNVRGGAASRPGTQYIGAPGSAGFARLYPFEFSTEVGQTYMLVFSALKIRFIKNPGTPSYPNSTNSGFVLSASVPYEVTTPYLEADLRDLHFTQVADVLWITARGYARRKLSRIADDNWTLTVITPSTLIAAPAISSSTITGLPTGSTDPQETFYIYAISAVDADGNESLPSIPHVPPVGVNIAVTQGTISLFWNAVADAVYYKVYKGLSSSGDRIPPPSSQLGFAGFSYGTSFTDSNIVPDFAQSPLQPHYPFASGYIDGYAISAPGSNYPVTGTTIVVTDGTGTGAVIYPILDNNIAGGVGGITGLYIANPGSGYTAPTIAAAGGGTGFTGTVTISPTSGIDPDIVGLSQQRLIYGSSINKPNTIWASRPGQFDDFRKSNPTVDNDAFEFAIAARQVYHISWMQDMPGGLLVATNANILQLTGGGGTANNPAAISPTNAVIVPQSFYGAAHIEPIIIESNILYITYNNYTVRDLQYNIFVNTYAGRDLTVLSNHLFEPFKILSWAYQDSLKVVWAVMSDGRLLSLTYVKVQEIEGWARHDTNGSYDDIAGVRESNENAIYVSVNRGGTFRSIERFATKFYRQVADAWCLDAALSMPVTYPAAALTPLAETGLNVIFQASVNIFVAGDVGKVITFAGSRGTIVGFDSASQVRVDIEFPFLGPQTMASGLWRMDPKVTVVTGLTHLIGRQVYALVDGLVQGPFTVSGAGAVTLTTAGASVVVGLLYICQLQPLYVDLSGELTLQGKRKKVTAASIRVKDAARLKYGTAFTSLQEWRPGLSSTDPAMFSAAPGLYLGDQRIVLNQDFNTGGWVCVEQSYPLPATVLSVIPELVQGDTA